MKDQHFASSFQQDLFNVLELYVDKPPDFPPENVSPENCQSRLSVADIDNAALMVEAYLGMGSGGSTPTTGFSSLAQCYFLNPEFRGQVDDLRKLG